MYTSGVLHSEFPLAPSIHLCRHNSGCAEMLEFVYSKDCCAKRWRCLKKFGWWCQTV